MTLSGGVLGLGDWRDFPQAHISRTAEEDSTSMLWRPLERKIGERVCGGLSDSDVREVWEEGNSEMKDKVEACLGEDNKYWWVCSFFGHLQVECQLFSLSVSLSLQLLQQSLEITRYKVEESSIKNLEERFSRKYTNLYQQMFSLKWLVMRFICFKDPLR